MKVRPEGFRKAARLRVGGGLYGAVEGENGLCQSRLGWFLDRFWWNFRGKGLKSVLFLHKALKNNKNDAESATNGQEKAVDGPYRAGAGRDRRTGAGGTEEPVVGNFPTYKDGFLRRFPTVFNVLFSKRIVSMRRRWW